MGRERHESSECMSHPTGIGGCDPYCQALIQYAKWKNEHEHRKQVPFFVVAVVGDFMMIWGVVGTVSRNEEKRNWSIFQIDSSL